MTGSPSFGPPSRQASSIINNSAQEREYSLQHLYAQLARLDAVIQREVRRWQQAGQDPGDVFRGFYISDEQAESLLQRPAASSWGQAVSLNPDEEAAFQSAKVKAAERAHQVSELAHKDGVTPRLERLANTFQLDGFDLDVILICLAPALDLRYERLYGYLQDDVTRKRPCVNLALDLLCEPGYRRQAFLARMTKDAPLFRNRLLTLDGGSSSPAASLLSRTLLIDETILNWLLGHYQPHIAISGRSARLDPVITAEEMLLAGEEITGMKLDVAPLPVFAFYGVDQARKAAAARCLSLRWGAPLLSVDLTGWNSDDIEVAEAVSLALRDARLTDSVLFISGWESVLVEGSPLPGVLAECCDHPGPLILSSLSAWQPSGVQRDRFMSWFQFPAPAYDTRLKLWNYYLVLVGARIDDEQLTALAGQFQMTCGQIRDTFLSARESAAQESRSLEASDLFAAARRYSNPRLSGLARKIEPRFDWGDIVLPDDQITLLHEIVATVLSRPVVLDGWGMGRKLVSSRGVTILFSGPPGTGKTMAAEVIAGELSLDLFKIDLSTIVSKYIGETEKNLERIFNEAETSNAILFFDEADALFGKRSEVRDSHDRYANIEISYLLQRMEAYDGVTILATNLRTNLDEAFTRRLQFAVDFPFPEEAYRLRIWQTLFPKDVPCAPGLDFGWISKRYKLAGGSIRNIIVNAAYLAASDGGVVQMSHLLHGTRRELQKMGRLLDENETGTP
jgi:ATP-dependent 26S proteasome regulatory subunit